MVLASQGVHKEIGTHITFWPSTFGGHEGFAFITSRADDHQEGPHILADDFGCLGNAQRSVTFHTNMGYSKRHNNHLIVKHFGILCLQTEGLLNGCNRFLLEANMRVNVILNRRH